MEKVKHTVIKKLRVKNELGLHTRPATMIVKLLQESRSEIFFTYKKERINAKSILSILMLAVQKNGLLLVEIVGEDAQETMERLERGFEDQFGEEF
ncbi:MAG: HPr family phosphocarrier protein [Chlamydiales bacterium]